MVKVLFHAKWKKSSFTAQNIISEMIYTGNIIRKRFMGQKTNLFGGNLPSQLYWAFKSYTSSKRLGGRSSRKYLPTPPL